MIRKGISAKTPELTQIAKYNAFCGNPYQWFDTAYFRNCGYHCITFDFFVDWKNKKIQRNIWTKRIIYKDFDISEKGVYNRIEIADGKEEIDNLFKFCGRYGFELEYILLYNIAPDEWNNLDNKIIIFNMSRYLTGGKGFLVFENSYEFRKRIDDVRQQSHSIGEMKGKAKLSYTTSTLEIFLAKDKFIYPGDADIVLLDDSFNAVAIIEVKKHSEGSEKYCELRTESMLRYSSDKYAKYQSQYKDPLKYQSLGYLKELLVHQPI